MSQKKEQDEMELHLVLKVRELQQVSIGQQRLIELQEKQLAVLESKITAAEKTAKHELEHSSYPSCRISIRRVLDAIYGVG